MSNVDREERPAPAPGPVRRWFDAQFPAGPTPVQAAAWPLIARGESVLLVSPTGSGKTFAAFLAILDRLFAEHAERSLEAGLRCVYISPLRSLGYDIERNLAGPLQSLSQAPGLPRTPIRVGVRTGDTSAADRRRLRDDPPHLLITTPESLALLLSQAAWRTRWASVEHVIVDEIHALVPNKRGADLAVSLERLSAMAARDPGRVGLSATCRPAERVARFLVGPDRPCRIVEAEPPAGRQRPVIGVDSLLQRDEGAHRGLTYRRLVRRLTASIRRHRTTVIFANTRAFTEKLTHDLRRTFEGPGLAHHAHEDVSMPPSPSTIAAHHSALDAARRREVEAGLKSGEIRAVVTSTSLELGVDIGTADQTVLVGLPGSVARCLQRIGRSGHQVGATPRGVLLAATPAELAGAIVTAAAAREGRVEPLRAIMAPLDVLSQQLVGMACEREWSTDEALALLRRTDPFAKLTRADLDSCLAYLAGDLASPAGAFEPEPGATPRWTTPRIWRHRGRFGVRNRRVIVWYRRNVGTITSEESVRVVVNGIAVGTLEASYAERLQRGDRFVLDGRALEFRRLDGLTVEARSADGEPALPRWSSDRQSLSAELARDLARFRDEAARHALAGPGSLADWLVATHALDAGAAGLLEDLFLAQEQASEVPRERDLLIEESPHPEGWSYAFHAPLGRSACEALGRAVAARLGRRSGRDVTLAVADLGWSVRVAADMRVGEDHFPELLATESFEADVLEGVDRGDLLARRFRHVAATGLMVLRNPEGGRTRVGGLLWVSQRLFPLVRAACPDHPLLREVCREVLDDVLDTRGALQWLRSSPCIRFRCVDAPSPFTAAWIDPAGPEPLQYEPPEAALRRLHARIAGGAR